MITLIRIKGTKSYRWVSPSGVRFDIMRNAQGSAWVWYKENDFVSSIFYPTLQALKQALAESFELEP